MIVYLVRTASEAISNEHSQSIFGAKVRKITFILMIVTDIFPFYGSKHGLGMLVRKALTHNLCF